MRASTLSRRELRASEFVVKREQIIYASGSGGAGWKSSATELMQ